MHTDSFTTKLDTPSFLETPVTSAAENIDGLDVKLTNQQTDKQPDLNDALDDDNENPVSQTLTDAAENSGPSTLEDSQELDGEMDDAGEPA